MAERGANLQADWPRWMRLLGETGRSLPGFEFADFGSGCIAAYQGDWLIAELRSGKIESHYGTSTMPVEGILPAAIQGLTSLSLCVGRPKPVEAWTASDRESSSGSKRSFGLLTAIQALQHGGTLLIMPDGWQDASEDAIRLKYAFSSSPNSSGRAF